MPVPSITSSSSSEGGLGPGIPSHLIRLCNGMSGRQNIQINLVLFVEVHDW